MTGSLYLLAPADRLMIKKDVVLKHPLFLSAIVIHDGVLSLFDIEKYRVQLHL